MSKLPLNQILCGNCVEVLKDFPDDSIDLVVTDPPYGLSFMGKDWDKTLPPREAFDEIIRVLKPGALAFVMSSPRQDLLWRMLSMLEGVGFELTQSYIDWIYKTGFPKAYDVSKGIDRRLIHYNPLIKDVKEFLRKAKEVSGLSGPQIDELLGLKGDNFNSHFIGNSKTSNLPTKEHWFKLKEILGFADTFDVLWITLRDGKSRPIIGIKENERNMPLPTQYDGKRIELTITQPASDLAKIWDGWKSQTGLKPAHEPILMVNKPFSESTIVDNVLRWGTGAINVDACRIPFEQYGTIASNPLLRLNSGAKIEYGADAHSSSFKLKGASGKMNISPKGRFPANLLVSDKAIDTGKVTKSEGGLTTRSKEDKVGKWGFQDFNMQGYGDVGDQSRYFDLDAWAKHHGFLDVPKPDNKERDFGLKGRKRIPTSKLNLSDGKNPVRLDGVIPNPRRNIHPTVKPIKLMAYLIELGCPPDGVVLDPFVGSGTTCIAAKRLHRRYIGIEINPEYHRMAEARISAYPVPLSWFAGSGTHDFLVPPIRRNEDG